MKRNPEWDKEFESYFADLKADARNEGYAVSKTEEREKFYEHKKELGDDY